MNYIIGAIRITYYVLKAVIIWLLLIPVHLFNRIFVCPFIKHDWRYHGGFFLFKPRYPFRCKRCNRGHNGDMDKPLPERF